MLCLILSLLYPYLHNLLFSVSKEKTEVLRVANDKARFTRIRIDSVRWVFGSFSVASDKCKPVCNRQLIELKTPSTRIGFYSGPRFTKAIGRLHINGLVSVRSRFRQAKILFHFHFLILNFVIPRQNIPRKKHRRHSVT